jgi:hypothetical protein
LVYNAGLSLMITRRDFTKLASIAAGTLFVPSSGESQENQAPVPGNPVAVASGFVQNAGAEIYYERLAVQQSCLPMGWAGTIVPDGSRSPIFHHTILASHLRIADSRHPASRLATSILHYLGATYWRWLITLNWRRFGSLRNPWEAGHP